MKITTYYMRAANFAILVIALSAMIALLGVLAWSTLDAAGEAQGQQKRNLMLFAYVALGALTFTALLLMVLVVRYIAQRLTNPPEPFKPTEYEDAWTEAGRRLKPEDAPPVEGFEEND